MNIMKKNYDHLGPLQKEALINEYKGNLFEYLVGHYLARELDLEKQFLADFGGEAKERLATYETWLRQNERTLLKALSQLALPVVEALKEKLRTKEVTAILVVGKSAGASHDTRLKEADLLIFYENDGKRCSQGVSLKLCKAHAFVNTKSGGLKSFFTTYFPECPNTKQWQERLNLEVQRCFDQMGHELYEAQGLGLFPGFFDQQWSEAGMSHLPGELPDELRLIVQKSYRDICLVLHEAFLEFEAQAKESFHQSLEALMGQGERELIQLTCFYKKTKEAKDYICDHVQEHGQIQELMKTSPPLIRDLREGASSFELEVGKLCLQIRVKPMNKFTQASYKVNCSVKTLKS